MQARDPGDLHARGQLELVAGDGGPTTMPTSRVSTPCSARALLERAAPFLDERAIDLLVFRPVEHLRRRQLPEHRLRDRADGHGQLLDLGGYVVGGGDVQHRLEVVAQIQLGFGVGLGVDDGVELIGVDGEELVVLTGHEDLQPGVDVRISEVDDAGLLPATAGLRVVVGLTIEEHRPIDIGVGGLPTSNKESTPRRNTPCTGFTCGPYGPRRCATTRR